MYKTAMPQQIFKIKKLTERGGLPLIDSASKKLTKLFEFVRNLHQNTKIVIKLYF